MAHIFFFGDKNIRPLSEIIFERKGLKLRQIVFQLNHENLLNILKNFSSEIQIKYEKKFKTPISIQNLNAGPKVLFMIDEKNHLWVAGQPMNNNQLGIDPTVFNLTEPFDLSLLHNLKFDYVQVGNQHVIGLTEKNELYGWGSCQQFKLGRLNDYQHGKIPAKIILDKDIEMNEQLSKIIAGQNHNFIITKKNRVISFGKNDNGVLGQGYSLDPYRLFGVLDSFKKTIIVGISAGCDHTLGWDDKGNLFSWGNSKDGKLGSFLTSLQDTGQIVFHPQKVEFLNGKIIIMAACGQRHSIALTKSGEVYQWGLLSADRPEARKKLNFDDFTNQVRPHLLKFNNQYNKDLKPLLVKISARNNMNAALDNNGQLFTWGENSQECLGQVYKKFIRTPKSVKILFDYNINDFCLGDDFMSVTGCKLDQTQLNKHQIHFYALNRNEIKLKAIKQLEIFDKIKPNEESQNILKQYQLYQQQLEQQQLIDDINKQQLIQNKLQQKQTNNMKEIKTNNMKEVKTINIDEVKINNTKQTNNEQQQQIISDDKQPNIQFNLDDDKNSDNQEVDSDDDKKNDDIFQKKLEKIQFDNYQQKFQSPNSNRRKNIQVNQIQEFQLNQNVEKIKKLEQDKQDAWNQYVSQFEVTKEQKERHKIEMKEIYKIKSKMIENILKKEIDAQNSKIKDTQKKIFKSVQFINKFQYIEKLENQRGNDIIKYIFSDPQTKSILSEKEIAKNLRKKKSYKVIHLNSILQNNNQEFKQSQSQGSFFKSSNCDLKSQENFMNQIKVKEVKNFQSFTPSAHQEILKQLKNPQKPVTETIKKDLSKEINISIAKLRQQSAKQNKEIILSQKQEKIITQIRIKSQDYKLMMKKQKKEKYEAITQTLAHIQLELLTKLILQITKEINYCQTNLDTMILNSNIIKRWYIKMKFKKFLDNNYYSEHIMFINKIKLQMRSKILNQFNLIHLIIIYAVFKRKIEMKQSKNKVCRFLSIHKMKNQIILKLKPMIYKIYHIQAFAKWRSQLLKKQISLLSQNWDEQFYENFEQDQLEYKVQGIDKLFNQQIQQLKKQFAYDTQNCQFLQTYNDDKEFISFSYFHIKMLVYKMKQETKQESKDNQSDIINQKSSQNSLKKLKQLNGQKKIFDIYPFTLNPYSFKLPVRLRIKTDLQNAQNRDIKFLKKAILIDFQCKMQIIKSLLKYKQQLYNYQMIEFNKQLNDFVQLNMQNINLERSKLLLRTKVKDLIQSEKKESIKFKYHSERYFLQDHLPFATEIYQIALIIKGAPQKPQINLQIDQKEFYEYFEKYRDLYAERCKEIPSKILIEQKLNKMSSN